MPDTRTTGAEEANTYQIALRQLENVARVLNLDDGIHAVLQKPKRELVRLVRNETGGARVDPTGKLDGRGAYLCHDDACWTRAERRKAVERALQVSLDASAWQNLLSSRPPLAVEETDSVATPAT